MKSLEELRNTDRKHFLHPFTNHLEMHEVGTHIIHSAKGVYVIDERGHSLLDGMAGLWCVNVGHGRREIADAVHQQILKIAFAPSFLNSTTEPTILLAERVTNLAPEHITHVFFSSSGSEANETTLKLIRAYQKLRGTPAKRKILSLTHGYHGVTLATTSMTQLPTCQTPFDLPLPGFIQIPNPYHYAADTELNPVQYGQWCIEETEQIIHREGADTIAALFVEPVQGAGGVIVPPAGYLKALREVCQRHSILFVADEVITGFGRLGAWFASSLWDLNPDFMTVAKGITSGYLPLGASLIKDEVADVLLRGGYLAHGYTYTGHPTSCAAALANLDILENEKLIEKTHEVTGPYFQARLQGLSSHPAVGQVRGLGLIGAVELIPKKDAPQTLLGPRAHQLGREEGVIIRGIRNIIAMAPPLVITEKEIDKLVQAVGKILDRI